MFTRGDHVTCSSVVTAPHRASLRGHGAAAPPVRQRLGADHCLGVRPGPVCALPGLHCVSRHHMEEEPHEVRKSSTGCQPNSDSTNVQDE